MVHCLIMARYVVTFLRQNVSTHVFEEKDSASTGEVSRMTNRPEKDNNYYHRSVTLVLFKRRG